MESMDTLRGAGMQRVTIPLTDAGYFDLDKGREKHVAAFVDAIKSMDPDQLQQLGLQRATGEESVAGVEVGGVTLENISQGLDWFNSFNASLFQKMVGRFVKNPFVLVAGKPAPLRIEDAIIGEYFKLTEKQHAELDPRALRIAQKYERNLPEWVKKHFDLYMLATMYFSYLAENAKAAISAQVKKDIARVMEASANKPTNPKPDSDHVNAQPVNGVDKNPPPDFTVPDIPEIPLA